MKNKELGELLFGFGLFVLGVCLILWAEKVTNLVSIILGILAVIYGIIRFVNYFKNDDRRFNDTLSFVYAIVVLIIGFILIFRVDFLKELISFIIGLYIVMSGILQLHNALLIKDSDKNRQMTLLILSLVSIFIGFLCLVGKFLIPDAIVRFIGVMICIYGIISIANVFIIKKTVMIENEKEN